MSATKDLTGQRFGRLTAIKLAQHTSYGMSKWLCQCDCGNTKEVTIANLGNSTKSCGCLRNTQGGLSGKNPLYKRWKSMFNRCNNPNGKKYHLYGALGVTICERWKHFPNFLEDMLPTYFVGATIDRYPNKRGNYEPGNCRWATPKQQANNLSSNHMIDTPWGVMTLAQAAERAGVPHHRLLNRLKSGWTVEQLFDPKNRERLTKWDRRRGARNVHLD
jgi:hypothetical protein